MKSKVLLFALASFCLIATTHAQVNKGAVLLGGNIGYNTSKTNYENSTQDTKANSFNISPAIGISIKQNLVFGVDLNFQKNTQKNYVAVNYLIKEKKEKYYGGGVFIRRYVPIISRLYVIAQGDAGFNIFKTTTENNSYYAPLKVDEKGWNTTLSFTPGISFAVNNKLHLESGFNNLVSLQYQKTKTDTHGYSNKSTTDSFGAGLNLENSSTFYLGFRILINGKG